jgi:hypothetical protein
MLNSRFVIFIVLILLARVDVCSKPSALQGRHFIVGFMQNEVPRTDLQQNYYMSIFVSILKTDSVIIRVPGEGIKRYGLSAGQIQEIKIPTYYEVSDIGVNKDKLIDIRSKSQMIVWLYSSKNQSSDSYVAIPVSIWGKQYRVVSMGNDMYNGKKRLVADGCTDTSGNVIDQMRYKEHITPRSSEFLVMASLDNTVIEYYPTCDTKNGVLKGQKGTTTLNTGECLLVQGAIGDVGSNDLTGTLVNSSNPVGIVSGHVRSAVIQGLDNPYDTKDHLIEMLPPTKAWGKVFVSIPFINGQNVSNNNPKILCNSGDLLKIIAAEDNTTLNYSVQNVDNLDNKVTVLKKAGDCFEIEAASPIIWNSDKPIMISQFMMHKGFEGESMHYDPALVILTPIEQYVEETTFSTPSNNNIFEQYDAHAFIAITDSIGIYSLNFDGIRLDANNTNVWCKRISNSKYYWLMKVVKNGTHKISASKGNFSGIIYGHGLRDSYAMTLGSRLTDPFIIDTISPLVEVDSACGIIKIRVSDIIKNDIGATGIDWGTINNVVNYNVSELEISDTATVIDIMATPIDTTKDGSFDIEFIDKNYNIVKEYFNYTGFNVERPTQHDFDMLKWNIPTQETLYIKNVGNDVIRLLSVEQSLDSRVNTSIQQKLPYTVAKNETLEINVTFTPNGSLTPLNTKIRLVFECHKIEISLIGEISAPGLLADDLDFEKVRLYDTKTLSGKIHNAGNIPLLITKLNKDIEEAAFEWSLNKTFPINIAIDDSINYVVKFTPSEEREYIVNSSVENNNQLDCIFYIKGFGGRPNIQNIEIDWGKKRIGTINDTAVYILNTGSFNDTINYRANVSITHSSDLSVDSVKKIQKIIIDELDSVKADYSFIPMDTIALENVFELTSSWERHTPITAIFKGQGTIPMYEAFDYDFGDVSIFSNIPYTHNCVYSFGNEALTIDSIVLIGGDVNSFDIDYGKLYNLFIEPNEYLELSIGFKPTFKGKHKVFLEITHDANLNYLRSKDTIEIYGNCITENTDLVVNLDVPILYSCNTEEALLSIKNTGEANIIIDSIQLNCLPNVFISAFVNNPDNQLPIELQHNEAILFFINIYAEREKKGSLDVDVFYNSENKVRVSEKIEPITSTIASTLTIPTNTIVPGDTIYLMCQSNILEKSEKDFKYEINLNVEKKLLYCLEKKCYIYIKNNGKSNNYLVDLEQYKNKIEFSLPKEFFEIDGYTTIQFELPLLVILAPEKEISIVYELVSDRCYYSESGSLDIKVLPVCADSLRQLLFDGFPYMSINQNPTDDEINLTINLLDKDNVSILVYDLLGNEVYRTDNNIYEKGKHNIKVKIKDATNAVYFVQTKSRTINTTQKVVIRK